MNSDTTSEDRMYGGRALVAAFPDRDAAQEAVDRLRDENFHDIWIGATSAKSDRYAENGAADTSNESLGEKIGRFFSGESHERGLTQSLIDHGVAESEAQRIDRSMQPNSAIVTVDGSNHPELAASIIEACGGHIVAGESFGDGASAIGSADALRGSHVLGYGNPDTIARGEQIDGERRIQLRSERLTVDKERESAGTAVVGTDVTERQQRVDVPVVREELFVERRPVSDETAIDDATPIGDGQTIEIPLTRERIRVTKRPVVTEEVIVGKRRVTETEHVDETLREEQLVTDEKR